MHFAVARLLALLNYQFRKCWNNNPTQTIYIQSDCFRFGSFASYWSFVFAFTRERNETGKFQWNYAVDSLTIYTAVKHKYSTLTWTFVQRTLVRIFSFYVFFVAFTKMFVVRIGTGVLCMCVYKFKIYNMIFNSLQNSRLNYEISFPFFSLNSLLREETLSRYSYPGCFIEIYVLFFVPLK